MSMPNDFLEVMDYSVTDHSYSEDAEICCTFKVNMCKHWLGALSMDSIKLAVTKAMCELLEKGAKV